MIEYLDEIQAHFELWYPKEACGILAEQKEKLKWFPCKNVSEEDYNFVFDPKEYLQISRVAKIKAIVHSHPDHSPEPSETDRNYCNATNLIYYIFSYPSMELYILKPERKDAA
tara:strand:- start:17 stop:355 length:339 start_codon:yes stop_codon:yes gene_type:complete